MDTEEIQNRLINLSRHNFRNVIQMILKEIFDLSSINVDGKGDGGSDWYTFTANGQKLRLGIQDTIQLQKWDEKALEDAKKCKISHGINRFFFCTNRVHEQIKVTSLENKITKETGLSATVLEGKKLAELISGASLHEEFLAAIGEGASRKRPQIPEIALCVYTNLSADRFNHRNEIYSDTVLVVCRDRQPISREGLVNGVLGFLGSASGQKQLVNKRLEHLLSERKIIRDGSTNLLSLSNDTAKSLEQTERLYLGDWHLLVGAQSVLVKDFGGHWSEEQAEQATSLLAQLFIQEQLEGLRSAGSQILKGEWISVSVNPKQQLRDLLQNAGVPLKGIGAAIGKMVEEARDREVIAKLTRTAVFAALEGQNPLQSSRAIGASSWSEVFLLLDASVAIPFLCASRTESVDEYLYALSSRAVETLRGLGADAYISDGHLEECASHLLRAFRYESIEADSDFTEALSQSDNAFIAFYYALKNEGRKTPPSLNQFLEIFSSRAFSRLQQSKPWKDIVRLVMPDMQEAFNDYGVLFQSMSRTLPERKGEMEKAHDWMILENNRTKSDILRRHDIEALGHIEARANQARESWILLTWDKLLINLAHQELNKSWVISPEVAMDFAQPCRKLSETQWSTLAHRLARISSPRDSLTARIIDQVARLRHERLHDWEFKQDIRVFREEALTRLPEQGMDLHQWIETETTEFLSRHDINQERKDEPIE